MIKKVLFVVIFFLFSSSCFSSAVDESLYAGNNNQLISRYESLLNKLNTSNNNEYSTQKTILYALINVLKYSHGKTTFGIDKIKVKNQSDYILLLKKIAQLQLKYKGIDYKIKQIEKKLKILHNTILSTDNSSVDIMTYQLQYAFYKITLKRLNKDKKAYENNFSNWYNRLYKTFLSVKFNSKIPQAKIKKDINKYNILDNEIEKLNIEKDRLSLLNRADSLSVTVDKLQRALKLRDLYVLNIIDNYILIDLYCLQHSKDLAKVNSSKAEWISKLTIKDNILLSEQENDLLYYLTKKKIGMVGALIKDIENGGAHMFSVVWHFMQKPLITIGSDKVSILSVVLALLVFVLGMYAGVLYKKHIKEAKFSKNITLSTKTILGNVGYYVIILITFFISLKIIGINLSSLAVILGALSVGIGFGLQNMVSNFMSGIILMLENSIRIGDYIEISDNLKGVVKDIQMRSTTVLTNDNIEVVIPNQTLFQNNVINWTLTEKMRRFKIPFGVAYGTDVEKVEKIILSALEKSEIDYVRHISDRAPEIRMVAMNSSSVDFNLDVWVRGDWVIRPRKTESEFLILIYNTLYEHNISIPFPQLDVHIIK